MRIHDGKWSSKKDLMTTVKMITNRILRENNYLSWYMAVSRVSAHFFKMAFNSSRERNLKELVQLSVFEQCLWKIEEAATGVLWKKGVLKNLQNSQKNTFSCELCDNFKNTYLVEHLQTAAFKAETHKRL